MSSVGSELLNEIERVSAKRQRWKTMSEEMGMKGMLFSVHVMTLTIDEGKGGRYVG